VSTLATVEDLSVRVPGGIPASDSARALAYLEDASGLIREETGQDFDDEIPPTARRICIAAALRAWFNPDFVNQTTIGDFTARLGVAGGVYLTEVEKADLAKLSASSDFWVQPIGRKDELMHNLDPVLGRFTRQWDRDDY
jgi:hypothetical protein